MKHVLFSVLVSLGLVAHSLCMAQSITWKTSVPSGVRFVDASADGSRVAVLSNDATMIFYTKYQDSVQVIPFDSIARGIYSNDIKDIILHPKKDVVVLRCCGLYGNQSIYLCSFETKSYLKRHTFDEASTISHVDYDLQNRFGFCNFRDKEIAMGALKVDQQRSNGPFTYWIDCGNLYNIEKDSVISCRWILAKRNDIKAISSIIIDRLNSASSKYPSYSNENTYVSVAGKQYLTYSIKAKEFTPSGNRIFTGTGLYDYRTGKYDRYTPDGVVISERFILCKDSTKKILYLWDTQNNTRFQNIAEFAMEIIYYHIINESNTVIAMSKDSVYILTFSGTLPPLQRIIDFRCDTIRNIGDTVIFTNNTYPKDGCRFAWNFGDNNQWDSTMDAKHIYVMPGFYTITLHVIEPNGNVIKVVRNQYIRIIGPTQTKWFNQLYNVPVTSLQFSDDDRQLICLHNQGAVTSMSVNKGDTSTLFKLPSGYGTLIPYDKSFMSVYDVRNRDQVGGYDMKYSWSRKLFANQYDFTSNQNTSLLSGVYCSDVNLVIKNVFGYTFESKEYIFDKYSPVRSRDGEWYFFANAFQIYGDYRVVLKDRFRPDKDVEISKNSIVAYLGGLLKYKSSTKQWFDSKSQVLSDGSRLGDSTSVAVFGVDISPSGKVYAKSRSASTNNWQMPNIISIHEIETDKELFSYIDSSLCVRFVDDNTILTRSGIRSLQSGEVFPLSIGYSWQYEWIVPGKLIAVLGTSMQKPVGIFDINNNRFRAWFDPITSRPTVMAISSNKDLFAVGTEDGSVFMLSLSALGVSDVIDDTNNDTSNNTITVYPNPIRDMVTITSALPTHGEVFSILGDKVLSLGSSILHNIDCSSWAQGMYYVVLRNGDSIRCLPLNVSR